MLEILYYSQLHYEGDKVTVEYIDNIGRNRKNTEKC